MIALTKDDQIILTPVSWGDQRIRQALYEAGFTEVEVDLLSPSGDVVPGLNSAEPTEALDLGNGYAMVPVHFDPVEPPAGQQLVEREAEIINGVCVVTPVYGPIPVPPAPAMADVAAAKQAEITASADAFLAPFGVEYGVYERATWDQQYAEAQAFTADRAASVPLLQAMAQARGITVEDLAGRILRNHAQWTAIAGTVIGQRQAYQDSLDVAVAANDVAAVQAITVTYSLPA